MPSMKQVLVCLERCSPCSQAQAQRTGRQFEQALDDYVGWGHDRAGLRRLHVVEIAHPAGGNHPSCGYTRRQQAGPGGPLRAERILGGGFRQAGSARNQTPGAGTFAAVSHRSNGTRSEIQPLQLLPPNTSDCEFRFIARYSFPACFSAIISLSAPAARIIWTWCCRGK